MEPPEIDALAARARAGDHAAFDALVVAVADDLRIFLAARCPSLSLVEEVLQAALVAAFESLPSYRSGGTFLPWLKGIARHLLLKELRQRARHLALEGDALEAALVAGSVELLGPDDDDPGRQRADLEDCLGRLTPRARALLERHHVHGLPLARLARQFKQTTFAIASALKRIRQSVRACVESRGARA